MSKFVCYTLEGLVQQGRNQVWVMMGTYPTAELARQAAQAAKADGGEGNSVIESRVMSYFRSADWWLSPSSPSVAVRAPHIAPQTAAARTDEASIVA